MNIKFYKYHGAGNDFVLIDNRKKFFMAKPKEVSFICDRHFGVGADGLMLLENHDSLDFTMRYFNADGHEATMCGNGGRCIVAFAKSLGIIENKTQFMASDGPHSAAIKYEDEGVCQVKLQMQDVDLSSLKTRPYFLDTGSPHHIQIVDDIEKIQPNVAGAEIRYSDEYKAIGGTNVNFVQPVGEKKIKIRTYERGVEWETLACGTGSTAAAIYHGINRHLSKAKIQVEAVGGDLEVSYEILGNFARNIFLAGPAEMVFYGQIEI